MLSLVPVLALFLALVCAPAAAGEGARQGLRVCAEVILPSLFPFLVFSGLSGALGLPRLLSGLLRAPAGALFGNPAAAAPFLLGLTGGYPVGAAAVGDLVRRGEADAAEGARLLAFCNNTGPAFILGAAGGAFGSAAAGLLLYLSHIASALAAGALLSRRASRNGRGAPAEAAAPEDVPSFARALPESVRGAVGASLNICGFVVLFSALTALLDAPGVFSAAAGFLARRTGAAPNACRALLGGVLELGGGIAALRGLPPTPGNLALASFLLGFGGLSVHCQALSVLAGTGVRARGHFFGKLLHGALSALVTFFLSGWIGA